MTTVEVLIPVLDRPGRVQPLLTSLAETSPRSVRPLFLISLGDAAEREAVELAVDPRMGDRADVPHVQVPWPATRGDYARKMNYGIRETKADWVLLAADDLRFRPGWLEAALACHAATHACVVGTNDLGNERVTSGRHSTHTLVHRHYLECGTIDEAGILLHEGYSHSFVDDELIGTAAYRETWAVAQDCHIEHLHPHWRKAPDDATYRKGQEHFEEDRALFARRQPLWAGSWRAAAGGPAAVVSGRPLV